MSVILDALKKLDREKYFRKNRTANIAVDILKPDLPPPEKGFPLYLATIFITALAGAMITYFIMAGFFTPKPSPLPPVKSSAPNSEGSPVPMEFHLPPKLSVPEPTNPPASSQQVRPAPISREEVREGKYESKRKSPKPLPLAEEKIRVERKPTVENIPVATSIDEKKATPEMTRKEIEAPPLNMKKIPEQPTTIPPADPPSLKVSAIVWYEDPSMRFIMVNGMKANEGSFVEGVKVVEINPTRVRFLYNGQYFEISM